MDDLEAMHDLGAWYGSLSIEGICEKQSLKKARFYYKKAANKGHPESQYDLGFMIIRGEVGEVEENFKDEGMELLRQAAMAGFEPAMELYKIYKQ